MFYATNTTYASNPQRFIFERPTGNPRSLEWSAEKIWPVEQNPESTTAFQPLHRERTAATSVANAVHPNTAATAAAVRRRLDVSVGATPWHSSEWVSSCLTAHQHNTGYSVPLTVECCMIYIKSNEHNIINNYNDKVKMILRSRLEANIKYVVTTLHSAIKMGFLDKIENVSGSNVIKKVLHWRSSKMFVTRANQCRAFY